MSTPTDDELLTMDGWPGGVNNRVRETEQGIMRDGVQIPSSKFLRKALNVDLTVEGHPLRRRGRTEIQTGNIHSLFASDRLGVAMAVANGLLYAGPEVDYTENSYGSVAVNQYLPISYCVVNDSVYWSNGDDLGEFNVGTREHRSWGIPVAPVPAVAGPGADNPNGWDDTRQIAVTYVDDYGREGGASEPVVVGSNGICTLTIPMPLPSGVSEARIYATMPGSEIFYHAQTTLTASVIDILPLDVGTGKELDTLNLKPPKAGQLVASLNGRVYIARNATVTFTQPLQPHLTRPSQGIYMFPDNVTLLQPVVDGVYVGHNHGVVFISGSDPYDIRQIPVSSYSPVPGAVSRIPGSRVGAPVDEVPVWWSSDGVLVVGLPGGQLRELTRDRFAVPSYAAGAVSLREYEGMSHIVSSLRSSDGVNKMGATDTVVASVRSHNIVLNS